MSDHHLYLSFIPEALIVSMLKPAAFGKYLATGSEKRSREQAIYLELDSSMDYDFFDLEKAIEKCKPHEDGSPKNSVYAGIYRVLENIPLEAMGDLWLTTKDGRVLRLEKGKYTEKENETLHLYHEITPVHPLIASKLKADDFTSFITDPQVNVSVPKLFFSELKLDDLAENPETGQGQSLPYKNISHLKDCLIELTKGKTTKTVNRIEPQHIHFRLIRNGFFIGDQTGMIYYPFPSEDEMENMHHQWWRSATLDMT